MQYLQIHIVKFKHGQRLYKRALRKNTACAQYIGATVEHGAGAKQRIHQSDRNGQKHAVCRGAYKLLRLFRHERERVFDDRIAFPVEYKAIADELNKMDAMEIGLVLDLLKLINSKRENR